MRTPTPELFARSPAIIGMVHVAALPGTPRARRPMREIIAQAADEARLYADHDLDAIIIENMHDAPYLAGDVGPEVVAAMTAVGLAVRSAAPLPLGVQVLAAANQAALAVALACDAAFVRVENFAFAQVADEGLMPTAAAGPLLRYRRAIGAEHVRIAADIKKKHASHAITADVPVEEAAQAAAFCGADAVIVTGRHTGDPADEREAQRVRQATKLPLWIGSGVTDENIERYWPAADAMIIGSHFKRAGRWANDVDAGRVAELMRHVARLRGGATAGGAMRERRP
ncbi:MAG: BtpA/SgcQ family protein [Phycisphaerae bacterium]|nr:BtpA/SgcQ family protein [Phycisphaerae bacterium]MCZ2401267.1 BtpA/SgcQ family protein [Phycisphaerae bacterium]